MWASLIHRLGSAMMRGHHRRFLSALRDPEAAQRRRLDAVLDHISTTQRFGELGLRRGLDYESFARRVPVVEYADLEHWIARQRNEPASPILARDIRRFLPTSGSTSARKWIPTNPTFGHELDAAASAWLLDCARSFPGLLDGPHYWSLSWIPDELRAEGAGADDLQLLPLWRRLALQRIMAVPGELALLRTGAATRRATLAYLMACRQLRLISVWSPSFLIALLDSLADEREPVAAILQSGRWEAGWEDALGPPPRRRPPRDRRAASALRALSGTPTSDQLQSFWPHLGLLSAWDSSTSSSVAALLRQRLNGCPLQGKGLWATEGVVSIPFAGKYPAALTSHFLEFRCLESGRVEPLWKLCTGQVVQPLLSTSGGLLRYALPDRVRVEAPLERTPCLRFLGRIHGVDLVGEKMDAALAEDVLRAIDDEIGLQSLSLLADSHRAGKPRYVLLAQGRGDPRLVAERVEARLRQVHHYALARDAGQLAPAAAVIRPDALSFYESLRSSPDAIAGATKLEAVWKLPDHVELEALPGLDALQQQEGGA